MEAMNAEKNLMCVLFPGIVKDVEKAVECLGGIISISEVYANKKRLDLSYQPNNAFVKKMSADSKKSSGVLLKVKVKKTKVDGKVKKEVVSTSVVGTVMKVFKFDALGDFQYLPVQHNPAENKMECIHESIMPTGLETPKFLLRESVQPFIPPPFFTRTDKSFIYRYTEKKSGLATGEEVLMKGLRNQNPFRVNFNLIDDFPSEPDPYYIQRLKAKVKLTPEFANDAETLKKMFEERPIWSLNALNYTSKIKKMTLKLILPTLAFFMCHGPWGKLWVRIGYDPRKEPGARFYQTLDFRVRNVAGVNTMVSKAADQAKQRKVDRHWHAQPTAEEVGEVVPEGTVIFRPGIALTQRQVFYQYCDIKLAEVSLLLSPAPPPGLLCHAARGWLAPGVDDATRDHIFRYAKQTLLAALKFEQPSSDEDHEDQNFDEEEASTSNADDNKLDKTDNF